MENEFDSEPVYNEKYLKTKIKYYERKFCANVHNDKWTKEGSKCICLSVTLIDSVCRYVKSHHPLVILEYIYIFKEKKILKHITSNL